MYPNQTDEWPPGLEQVNVSVFNFTAALEAVRGDKFSDDRWLHTLKHQCRVNFHFDYKGSADKISLLRLQLQFVGDVNDLIVGWADATPSRWDCLAEKLTEHKPNSMDDVLVDWKPLFRNAIKKDNAADLIAHLSKGNRAQDTGFITFGLPSEPNDTMHLDCTMETNS
ncbi:hypothetical protein PG984_003685 [Apiospora sp. TS-2023a]